MSVKELSRYDVLLSQFPNKAIEHNSLMRIFHFLYENTDIYYLALLKEETLVDYLKYHRSKEFEVLSFTQAVNDIKIFILYLKNKRGINKEFKLDMSLENHDFWINL